MEDMTGKIYGDLTVIKFSHYDKKTQFLLVM